jgi:NAD(P)-dependent dehydrogenase (short-subunit alcohol dehydrogenase family)
MATTARPMTATTRLSGSASDKRVVIMLGASSGIGRACARAFAAQGARVVLAARGSERLTQARRECDDDGATAALALTADVLEQDQLQHVVDRAVAAFGRIDVVVHSANVMAYGTIEQVPPRVFERVVDTAILGTANVARSILPTFREQGRGTLVIVTSLLASVPVPSMGAYIAGKWGQLALARVLQLEVRNEPDVHVCTVAPGSVDTPIFRHAANFAGHVGRPPPPVVSAQKVAQAVLRTADRPVKRRSVGPANGIVVLGYRMLPRLYDRLVGPLARIAVFARDTLPPTEGNVFVPQRPDRPDDHPSNAVPDGTAAGGPPTGPVLRRSTAIAGAPARRNKSSQAPVTPLNRFRFFRAR